MLTDTLTFVVAAAALLNAWQTSTAISTARATSTTRAPTTSGGKSMTMSQLGTLPLTTVSRHGIMPSSHVPSKTTTAVQPNTKANTVGVTTVTVAAAAAATQQLTIVLVSVLVGLVAVLTLIVVIVVLVRKGRCTSCCRRDQHERTRRKPSSQSNAGINHQPIAASDAVYGVGLIQLDHRLPPLSPTAGVSLAIDNAEYMQTSRLLSLSDDGDDDVECVSKETTHANDQCVKPYACTSLLSQPAHRQEEAASGGHQTDDVTPYYSLPPLLEELPSPHSSAGVATAPGGAGSVPAASASCNVTLTHEVHTGASDGAGYAEPLVDRPESVYFVVDAIKR